MNVAAGRSAQVDRDLELMAASYGEAQAIAETSGAGDIFYPATNCLVAEVALNAGRGKWRTLDPKRVGIIRNSLKKVSRISGASLVKKSSSINTTLWWKGG